MHPLVAPAFVPMAEDPIERVRVALDDMRAGRIVILVDDEDRENEGDLTIGAELVTPEVINFMATHGRGLICLTLTGAQVERLGLPMMAAHNSSPYGTAFTVSIEAREGVTTGISAADRAHTCLVASSPEATPQSVVVPGHIFPLRAREGGVLTRTGQTEGSVDLARLAGLRPAGVICEIMNDDGTMARLPDLERFASRHGLHIVTVADLIRYRMQHERLVRPVLEARLPVPGVGSLPCRVYRSDADGGLHLAVWNGPLEGPTLVRVQSANPVTDVLRAAPPDGQVQAALRAIAAEGGVLLYLHVHGGRGEQSFLDLVARHLEEPRQLGDVAANPAGPPAALRVLGTGAQILVDLGVNRLRLLTNSDRKIVGLEAYGLEVVERVALGGSPGNAPHR